MPGVCESIASHLIKSQVFSNKGCPNSFPFYFPLSFSLSEVKKVEDDGRLKV
jgi:hypothetical protein